MAGARVLDAIVVVVRFNGFKEFCGSKLAVKKSYQMCYAI